MYDGINENTFLPDSQIFDRSRLIENNIKHFGYAEENLNPARGIACGMIFSAMFWIPTIAFVYWLL